MAKRTTPPPSDPATPAEQAASLDARQRLIDAYKALIAAGDHATELSVAEAAGLTEAEFHQHFASADAVGRAAWQQLAQRVADKLQGSEAFRGYGARERVLAYNFTWVADAVAERSFIRNSYYHPALLTDYRADYKTFVAGVLQEGIAMDEVQPRLGLDNVYPDWLLTVHMGLITYWLADESPDFADTERAIETRHKLPLEFMGRNILDSVYESLVFEFQQLKLDKVWEELRTEADKAGSWFRSSR